MSQKQNAERWQAPGIEIAFQPKTESNTNMLIHRSAVKAELPFAVARVMRRYDVSRSLAKTICALSGLGGGA